MSNKLKCFEVAKTASKIFQKYFMIILDNVRNMLYNGGTDEERRSI